jgi:hypothetical protein
MMLSSSGDNNIPFRNFISPRFVQLDHRILVQRRNELENDISSFRLSDVYGTKLLNWKYLFLCTITINSGNLEIEINE